MRSAALTSLAVSVYENIRLFQELKAGATDLSHGIVNFIFHYFLASLSLTFNSPIVCATLRSLHTISASLVLCRTISNLRKRCPSTRYNSIYAKLYTDNKLLCPKGVNISKDKRGVQQYTTKEGCMLRGCKALERDVLHSRAYPRTPRKRHHIFVQFVECLVANQPTLGAKGVRIRKDVRIMMVYVRAAGDVRLRRRSLLV